MKLTEKNEQSIDDDDEEKNNWEKLLTENNCVAKIFSFKDIVIIKFC